MNGYAARQMKLASLNSSCGFHCFASFVVVFGSIAGWILWFSFGGWQRQQHWGDGMLWAASAGVGLWAAIGTIRLAHPNGSAIAQVGVCLVIVHVYSLFVLQSFIVGLITGDPDIAFGGP
jgi:hypothetical protein